MEAADALTLSDVNRTLSSVKSHDFDCSSGVYEKAESKDRHRSSDSRCIVPIGKPVA
jgi:hypothetical protein